MYYFFMDRNFNLDKYDFDVNFSPRLTKAERDLLNIFLVIGLNVFETP